MHSICSTGRIRKTGHIHQSRGLVQAVVANACAIRSIALVVWCHCAAQRTAFVVTGRIRGKVSRPRFICHQSKSSYPPRCLGHSSRRPCLCNTKHRTGSLVPLCRSAHSICSYRPYPCKTGHIHQSKSRPRCLGHSSRWQSLCNTKHRTGSLMARRSAHSICSYRPYPCKTVHILQSKSRPRCLGHSSRWQSLCNTVSIALVV